MKVKLRELGEIVTGNTPSKQVTEFWDSDDICFVKPDTISDTGISTILSSVEHLAEAARSKARVVGNDAVLVTCIGSIGKIGITGHGEFAFNQQINAIIPNKRVNPKYLAYALFFAKPQLIAIANAPVVPIINKSQFGDFEINIAEGIQEQAEVSRILDKVVGVISKRQQQLSALDDLIKARFVEMFGDPVSNSLQLPVEHMSDRYALKAGITTSADEIHDFSAGEYEVPCYGGNGIRGYVENASYEGTFPIIGRQGALCGNVQLANARFHATEHAVLVSILKDDDPIWTYHMLQMMDLYRFHTGAAQPGLAVKTLNAVDVIVTNKEEQKEFVAFVTQIDKSKSVIQKSLDETQLLFDSLMQKYFG